MLARVAENIYWLSRYLERAENTVRLIDEHSRMLLDLPDMEDHSGWIPLILINSLNEEFAEKYNRADETSVCHFLLADEDNSASLLNAFFAIQANLRSCRDVLPRSTYEAINGACRFVKQHLADSTANPNARNTFLNAVQTRLQAISGNINSNMSRGIGYSFMRMGCVIERADMTSRIIDVQSLRLVHINDVDDIALQQQRWVSVLRSLSAVQMYRQHVRRPINGEDTLRFLLHSESLPRSYTFCLNHLDRMLNQFTDDTKPRQAISALRKTLNSRELAELAYQPLQLHKFIDSLQMGIEDVAGAVADNYFLPPQDS